MRAVSDDRASPRLVQKANGQVRSKHGHPWGHLYGLLGCAQHKESKNRERSHCEP